MSNELGSIWTCYIVKAKYEHIWLDLLKVEVYFIINLKMWKQTWKTEFISTGDDLQVSLILFLILCFVGCPDTSL